ncbi:MAG: SDR family NAD(P)-dependent oxidoreductase [Planctomycetota bacterium]|nr:SDR family NAD(P)-dependent oxidoreductase [Planctomycetota bacterium]
MKACAIVVGASSGIGEALARKIAGEGRTVALLARRGDRLTTIATEINDQAGEERAFAFAHDVAKIDEVEPLWERIESSLGTVDEIHLVSAVMPPVGPDEFDTAKDREMIGINVLGAIAWGNAAARRFSKAGHGRIVGISSVAQDRGRVGRPVYGASKACMDHYLEALRNRLWRKGVRVMTVRPGFVETPMTEDVEGMFWLISAERAAGIILKAMRRGKAVIYVPARWRLMMFVVRSIPSFLFRKLNV